MSPAVMKVSPETWSSRTGHWEEPLSSRLLEPWPVTEVFLNSHHCLSAEGLQPAKDRQARFTLQTLHTTHVNNNKALTLVTA